MKDPDSTIQTACNKFKTAIKFLANGSASLTFFCRIHQITLQAVPFPDPQHYYIIQGPLKVPLTDCYLVNFFRSEETTTPHSRTRRSPDDDAPPPQKRTKVT